ncbi:NAD(P)/FAD-dependent oxidoreductase [Candidatus Saccharibacteria bacterium]|nr:NAD(P)/FAD-dependent oxidoreductase [Candidatus Saccharibacteria bacterium]
MAKIDKHICIIGAGTAGIMLANKLANKFEVTVIDPAKDHYYQPGFLFMPFGRYKAEQLRKSTTKLVNKRANLIAEKVANIDFQNKKLATDSGTDISFDVLVVATGTRTDPSMTEGLLGDGWQKNVFDFYNPDGAEKLHDALKDFKQGTLAIQIMDMPIKCPVAPLEFTFLADDYFKKRGIRENITIKYITPLSGAFTKPVASAKFGHMLEERKIELVSDFYTEKVVETENKVVCFDGREVIYDLLVTVPVNVGSDLMRKTDIVNDLGFVEVNHGSLQSAKYPFVFAVGDAADLPTSKAGSVAHFEVDTLAENIPRFLEGKELEESFDGHSNCFVEMGGGKALLLDFNYQTQPYEGTFPFPGVGPMKLLQPSRVNHWGKLAFRFIYWWMLLPGRKIPFINAQMSLKGKKIIES